MNVHPLLQSAHSRKAYLVLAISLLVLVGSVLIASQVQTNFGRVEVTNAAFENANGIPMRAKLFRPLQATSDHRLPGLVYVHGYQNNRETAIPTALSLPGADL